MSREAVEVPECRGSLSWTTCLGVVLLGFTVAADLTHPFAGLPLRVGLWATSALVVGLVGSWIGQRVVTLFKRTKVFAE